MTQSTYIQTLVSKLQPLHRAHKTMYGQKFGFFVSDITSELGSLDKASKAIMALSLENLLMAEFVVFKRNEDAHTLYRLVGHEAPSAH
ncbi:MAG: hypothetical protein EKK47_19995 [Burkholderiales bacterium]|nr:MAG: hypothetical protein EKK47_19995 [Burkholderiales bacterium]